MGLIRFLFFLLILYVLWFMAKNYLRKQERRERERANKTQVARIVRCKHCEVHLPEPDALRDGEDWFCTPAHKQAWLDRPDKNDSKRS